MPVPQCTSDSRAPARIICAAIWDIAGMLWLPPAEWEARGRPKERLLPLTHQLLPREWLEGYQANYTAMLRYARKTFPNVSCWKVIFADASA